MIQLRCASPFQTGTSRTPLWIGDYIGTVHLHKVWLQPEAGLQFVIIRQLFICLSGAFTHFQRYVNSYPA